MVSELQTFGRAMPGYKFSLSGPKRCEDYHRVHSPVDGTIQCMKVYEKDELFPGAAAWLSGLAKCLTHHEHRVADRRKNMEWSGMGIEQIDLDGPDRKEFREWHLELLRFRRKCMFDG